MKEIQVVVGDKEFTIKELLYKDLAELTDLSKSEMTKKLIMSSAELTEEDYNLLTIGQGIKLQNSISELNNLTDFQDPQTQKSE